MSEAIEKIDPKEEALSLAAVLIARQYVYEFFHKALGGEPCEELFTLACSETSRSIFDEYASVEGTLSQVPSLLKEYCSTYGDEALDKAKSEYGRVFFGPRALPGSPWESSYVSRERSVFQTSTLEIRRLYKERGLQVLRLQGIPEDHVSIMCCFMSNLSNDAVEALLAADFEALTAVLKTQQAFALQHLCTWLPKYAADLQSDASIVLYDQLMEVLAQFVAVDAGFTGEALSWVKEVSGLDFGEIFALPKALLEAKAYTEKLEELDLRFSEENKLYPISN